MGVKQKEQKINNMHMKYHTMRMRCAWVMRDAGAPQHTQGAGTQDTHAGDTQGHTCGLQREGRAGKGAGRAGVSTTTWLMV